MRIIIANVDHLPSIQKLGQETYQQHFSNLWTTVGITNFLNQDFSLDALNVSFSDKNQVWFLLFNDDDIPQGFAKINLNKYQQNLKDIGTELQKIYFLKTATNNNFGHHLLQFILNYLSEKNCQFIYLEVLSHNIKAQKFYKKYNFKESLEIPYATDLYHIGMKIMTLTL